MQAGIRKWGNRPGVRIPRAVAERSRLAEGTAVEIVVHQSDEVIRLKPMSLDDLLARVTPDHCHEAAEWGAAHGLEWE